MAPISTHETAGPEGKRVDRDIEAFLTRSEHFGGHVPTKIETHISKVFVGGDHVFKLKKALSFDFLDYATVDARHVACEREVELNRRLAPDVYLGVRPITIEADGTLHFGAPQDPSARVQDWVVEMRRLPEEKMLDQLLRSGRASREDCSRLAALLGSFYANATRISVAPGVMADRAARHVHENLAALVNAGLPDELVRRIHGRQLQFIAFNRQLFDVRVASGRVIDGHGDLRPEHMCLISPPVIFDCIEFNDELRAVDVADELGFFAMECAALGAPTFGVELLQACEATLGDAAPAELIAFYESYRACVRAKVAAIKSRQASSRTSDGDGSVHRYLNLADHPLGRSGRPLCVIMRGVSGSGKSTIAARLAEELGMAHLATNSIRRELLAPSGAAASYGEGRYLANNRRLVYNELGRRARELLRSGRSVVCDGAFLTAEALAAPLFAAQSEDVPPLVVECFCADDTAKERIAARARTQQSASEIRPEHIAFQHAEFEPLPLEVEALRLDRNAHLPPDALPPSLLEKMRRLLAN